MELKDVIKNARDREKTPLAKDIAEELVRLGHEDVRLRRREMFTFDLGVNVGYSKALEWVLKRLREEE
ncbi:MAG: hypothetical protein J6Y37_00070 [Paludibacteraceae bacterium]|nr:hypothetical protein [Paludibacteraceae bacterium]